MGVPVAVNGLALGLSGVASVVLELSPNSKMIMNLAMVATYGSAALLALFICDRAWRPRLVMEDFEKPQTSFAYGAGHMTFLFCWLRLVVPRCSQTVAVLGLWIAAGAQLLILFSFLKACYRHRCYPEPFWGPPLCDCCVTAIVGAALWHGGGLTNVEVLLLESFGLAVLCIVIVLPIQVYRTLKSTEVAPNTTVGVLQAPPSLSALTWGIIVRSRAGGDVFFPRMDNWITHGLIMASTFCFWVTLFCTWRRRRVILKKGFGLDWSNFVFPTCSSAVAILQYTSQRHADPAASTFSPDTGGLSADRIYAFAVTALALSVAGLVTLGVFLQTITNFIWPTKETSLPTNRLPLLADDSENNKRALSKEGNKVAIKIQQQDKENNFDFA